MTSKEITKITNGQKNKIIELVRAEVDEMSMLGTLKFCGAELCCVQNAYDFMFDGFKYIRSKYISDILTCEKNETLGFYSSIYSKEKLFDGADCPYKPDTFRKLFEELAKSGEAVTVECNFEEAIDYYLGRVVSLTGNLATMQCFDGNGEIFKDKVRVNLDFVSMVTVGDRYTSTMAKYVNW